MLTSKARRRLAQKTSALGLTGTLVLFAGALLAGPTPAAAEAETASVAVEKSFSYTCETGGPFTAIPITVDLSAPDSAAAGTTFDLKVGIPPLTLTSPSTAASTVGVTATLTPTNGTIAESATAKTGATIPGTGTAVPAGDATYRVTVTAGATGKVSIKPGDIKLAVGTTAGAAATTCKTTSTDVLEVTIGTGSGTGTDIIAYTCTVLGGTTTDEAEVDIKVTPTMPTSARANQDASITWTGAVQSTGDPLPAPTAGFPTSSKLFATVKASGAGAPASATGEAALTSTTQITTLPNVTIKVKPTTTGTVTITPGDLVFGTSATATTQAVKCTAPTTGLKTYTFTVSAATSTPTSSNTPTTSNTPTPTRTKTEFVTETPTTRKSPTTRSSQTPKKGAATGAGGDAGPDGRMFLLAGSVLVLGAGAGGLLLRRRNVARG